MAARVLRTVDILSSAPRQVSFSVHVQLIDKLQHSERRGGWEVVAVICTLKSFDQATRDQIRYTMWFRKVFHPQPRGSTIGLVRAETIRGTERDIGAKLRCK